MHASLKIGETRVMASDGRNTGNPKFDGFALSVNAKDEADADRLFNGLSAGGNVIMPLGKTFFSPRFGMTHRQVRRELDGHCRAIVSNISTKGGQYDGR